MGHHFYTINRNEGDTAEREAEFKFEGPAAFVFPHPAPDTVALLRLFRGDVGDGGDHFYTTDPDEAERAVREANYRREPDECFVFDPGQPQPDGTVPLLRFFNGGITDHFYTIAPNGENAEAHGWRFEVTSCFVFNNQQPGTVELRRYFRRGDDGISLGTFLEIVEGVITVAEAL